MQADLNSMKVPELKALAKEAGIEGADGMKKAELIAALEKPIEAAKKSSAYQDHMAQWESKAEKAEAKKSSESDLDYQSHPKFHKFKAPVKGAK